MRLFCTGWGSLSELTFEGAQALADAAGIPLAKKLDRTYLKVNGCDGCQAQMSSVALCTVRQW